MMTTLAQRPARPAGKPPAAAPVVTEVDDARLRQLLLPANGRPLLVNFWATWCDPCREEFPELVALDAEFKGKIDLITVSLDDAADIRGAVPKFLTEMRAAMPAYLLVSRDESALISSVAKDWSGGLPFTILYRPNGEIAYFRQGKIVVATLRSEIEKLVSSAPPKPPEERIENPDKQDAENN